MTHKETPSANEQSAECLVPPASADPAASAPQTTRRDFLKAGGTLSLSSLMGTAALMTQTDDAHAAAEWAEHFQKNYRLMTDAEKAEARARLERRDQRQTDETAQGLLLRRRRAAVSLQH